LSTYITEYSEHHYIFFILENFPIDLNFLLWGCTVCLEKDFEYPCYAGPFSKDGVSTTDECCEYGSGYPPDDYSTPTTPGIYFIKCPSFSNYIGFSGDQDILLAWVIRTIWL
jgi:hypothetical protein